MIIFGGTAEKFGGTLEKFGGTTEKFGGTLEKYGGTAEKIGATRFLIRQKKGAAEVKEIKNLPFYHIFELIK